MLLGAATAGTAHAGLLTYQGVTLNSAGTGNALPLEIDAAHRSEGNKVGSLLSQTGASLAAAAAPGGVTTVPVPAPMPIIGPGALPILIESGYETAGTQAEVPEPWSPALLLGGLTLMGIVRQGLRRAR